MASEPRNLTPRVSTRCGHASHSCFTSFPCYSLPFPPPTILGHEARPSSISVCIKYALGHVFRPARVSEYSQRHGARGPSAGTPLRAADSALRPRGGLLRARARAAGLPRPRPRPSLGSLPLSTAAWTRGEKHRPCSDQREEAPTGQPVSSPTSGPRDRGTVPAAPSTRSTAGRRPPLHLRPPGTECRRLPGGPARPPVSHGLKGTPGTSGEREAGGTEYRERDWKDRRGPGSAFTGRADSGEARAAGRTVAGCRCPRADGLGKLLGFRATRWIQDQ